LIVDITIFAFARHGTSLSAGRRREGRFSRVAIICKLKKKAPMTERLGAGRLVRQTTVVRKKKDLSHFV